MSRSVRQRIECGVVLVLASIAAACGSTGPNGVPKGLASCQGTEFLTVSPIDPADIGEIAPLGNLSPPYHTLPTDHIYVNTTPVAAGVAKVATVVAPGTLVIVEVTKQTRTGGGQSDGVNYGLRFFPCADVAMYFAHLITLSAELASQVGQITECDPPSSSGGITSAECRKRVEINLAAGAQIGTAGGTAFPGIDYGGADSRTPELAFVNPGRSYGSGQGFGQSHTICPVDYFVPAVASALRAKFGRNGVRRTIAPVCGTIMQDVANTAQGRWYFDNTARDDPHLALAHDNGDPRIGVISAGISIPSLPTGAREFTPATSGRVNLDFPLVTNDGSIYCYQTFSPSPPPPLRHVLIQLTSPTQLRIEGVIGATCGDPSTWTFTSGAKDFTR